MEAFGRHCIQGQIPDERWVQHRWRVEFGIGLCPGFWDEYHDHQQHGGTAASNPINGTFSNLAQNATVTLSYLGTTYYFEANYQGGDGNDLVLTNVAGPATQLLISTQPSAVTAGVGFSVTVTAEDANGNLATSFTGSETIALAANPGSSTLGGTLTVSATNGIATFTGLTLNKLGNGYTLAVTSSGLTSATSASISVTSGTATQLLITTEPPGTVTAGVGLDLTVTAEDANGNLATSFTGSETIALAANPGSSTLGGILTVSATSGIATFTGLTLNKLGSGYTLAVTSSGLASATSTAITVVPGSATQLLITSEPPGTVTAGVGFGLTVTAEDIDGNVASGFTGSETIALAANPGSSTLGGTLTVSATSGIATFTGLTLNKVGSGYTLAVTNSGLTSATSTAVTVTSGTATQLLITSEPPGTVTAGVGFGLTVTAEDIDGNVATSFTGSETIALAANPGSSTLGGTLTVSATSGIATFTGLTLNKLGSGYTLAVTNSGLTSATSTAVTVTSGTATQLLITSEPPGTVTAGVGFGLTVAAEDIDGNVATGFTESETIALAANPGSSTLGGTLTVSATSGIATFTGLTLNKVGSGYTLAVTNSGLTSATSTAVTVTSGTATQLLITSEPPGTVTAGVGFGLTVTAEDIDGNVATSFTGSETIALAANPGSSTLGGTLTVSATNGIATFTGLTLNTVGSGYTLAVTSSGLTSATSTSITVVPGAATQLLITSEPPGTVTASVGFGLTVTAEDIDGNVASGFTGSETIALASNPGSSTLGGTLTVSATSGIATFTGLMLNKVGSGYTLAVTSSGLTSATSTAISVTSGAATQLLITTEPPGTATAGVGFGLTVTAEDVDGNVATGFTGSETIALAANPGSSTLGGTLTVSATSGIATFTGLTLNKVGSGYTLAVTNSGLTSATSTAVTVTSGTATQLLITSEPPGTVTAGVGFGLTVTAEDIDGNVATSFTGSETIALAANPGSSTLGGTLTVSATNGIATFTGLTLNTVGSGYTLAVTSSGLTSATSTSITVVPGAATQLLITSEPPGTVTASVGFGLTVTAEDIDGNVASGFTGSETIALASNPGSSTLGGTLTVSATSGIATFTGLMLNKVGSGYTLAVTSSGLTSATSTAISVASGAATQLLITTEPPGTATAGVGFGLTVTAEDVDGNVATGFTGSETIALAANPGSSTLGGTLTVSATSGIATFTGLTLNKVGSGYTLAVTSSGLASATSTAVTVTSGTATQLLITSEPPGTVTAGVGFGLTVAAEDIDGNVASGFTGSETIALAANPGSSTVGGTLTVSATSGIATFTGLTLNKLGSGYTLAVTSSGLASATSTAITVVPGSATQLLITSEPPGTVTAGVGFGLTVTAEDIDGNVASGFTGSETIALAANPGSSTLGGTLTVSATSGIATFTGLTLNKVGSGYTLAVTNSGLTSATSTAVTVTSGTATQLLITSEPPGTVTAGVGFGLTVTAEDIDGNVATSFTGSETIALAANPGSSTLGGTLTVSATSGIATFTGLTLNKVGSGYTLAVTSSGLTSATTADFILVPGSATQLVYSGPSLSSVTAGVPFSITVIAEDIDGNVATGFTGNVIIAIANNPGSSTLGGTLTVVASNGVAVFSGLTLNIVDVSYTFIVTSSGLTSATTADFNLVPGSATQLVYRGPSLSSVTAGVPFSITVIAEDIDGNVATGFTGNVIIAIANNPGSSTLGGTLTVVASNGVAVFSGLTLNIVDVSYTFIVTSSGLTSATTADFNLVPGSATQLVYRGPSLSSVTAGVPFSITVIAEDIDGNVATGFTGNVIIAIANNPGSSTLGGTLTVVASNGFAVFSGLTLNIVDVSYTLVVTSSGLTSATSTVFSVTASGSTKLVITTQPPATIAAGSSFDLTVEAEYADGTVDTAFTGDVTVALANNSESGVLGGTLTVSAVDGVAVFSDLIVDEAGSSYSFVVTSGALSSLASSTLTVVAGPALQFASSSQPPATVTAGTPFSFTFSIEDAQGNIASDFSGQVTISLDASEMAGTVQKDFGDNTATVPPATLVSSNLGGMLTANVIDGVATFSDLTLNDVGAGYRLRVSAPGLVPFTTDSVDVAPGAMTVNGTSSGSDDDIGVTFLDASDFVVTVDGTSTTYSTNNYQDFVYNGPLNAYSKVVVNDSANTFAVNQSLTVTQLIGSDFEIDLNNVANLYIYGNGNSTASVSVPTGIGDNFFVASADGGYSYIADPINGTYCELSGFGSETVAGSAGATYAYIYSMSHASTVASPTQTTFTVGGATLTLSDFPQVYVVAPPMAPTA